MDENLAQVEGLTDAQMRIQRGADPRDVDPRSDEYMGAYRETLQKNMEESQKM